MFYTRTHAQVIVSILSADILQTKLPASFLIVPDFTLKCVNASGMHFTTVAYIGLVDWPKKVCGSCLNLAAQLQRSSGDV